MQRPATSGGPVVQLGAASIANRSASASFRQRTASAAIRLITPAKAYMYKTSKLRFKLAEYFRGYIKIYPAFLQPNHIATTTFLHHIASDDRYRDPKRLLRFGAKSYSQCDEDGIIQEIFRRIGTTNQTFVEAGVGNGLENNSTLLLIQGWKGLWIEGSPKNARAIRKTFASAIERDQLRLLETFVTRGTIDSDIQRLSFSEEPDLFSLDLDGNDFHFVQDISSINPRVVILEYNAKFIPPVDWVMSYNEKHLWDGSDYFGASLTALTALMASKGYSLVGCNLSGANAFFVRNDLAEDKFCSPFTAENHYEPARYWIIPGFVSGQPASFGPFAKSDELLR
jgi:hypothetical protein